MTDKTKPSFIKRKRLLLITVCTVLILSCTVPVFAVQKNIKDTTVSSYEASIQGDYIRLQYKGSSYWQQKELTVNYSDGSSETIVVVTDTSNITLKMPNEAPITAQNVRIQRSGEEYGAAYSASVDIPLSVFIKNGKTITGLRFCGIETTADEMGLVVVEPEPQAPEQPELPNQPTEPSNPGQGGGSNPQNQQTPQDGSTVNAKIVIDGNPDDWANISKKSVKCEKDIDTVRFAKDEAGNLYINLEGTARTEWVFDWLQEKLKLSTSKNQWDMTIDMWANPTWSGVSGTVCKTINNANHESAAPFCTELMIPAGHLGNGKYTVSIGNVTVSSDKIPVIDGNELSPEAPAVYNGIVIDGLFKDWAAVQKSDYNGFNNMLAQTAMVFDGDNVFIYINDKSIGAYHAGTHGNGKFAITTDLNRQLVFTLNYDGSITTQDSVSGAQAKRVGSEWEISIPTSQLPPYTSSLSFGMYQQEPVIKDVSDLQGGKGGVFTGPIIYDGYYDDWKYYPHHIIEYDTAGTAEDFRDAEGALWYDAKTNRVIGHVVTVHPEHLNRLNGYEYATGVRIDLNGIHYGNPQYNKQFEWRVYAVDSKGNITWQPDVCNNPNTLPPGEYTYRIYNVHTWGSSKNINDPQGSDKDEIFYGEIHISVHDDVDECEFWVDVERLAKWYGIDPSEVNLIEAQFLNIGEEWISIAGASSGAFLGIAISVCVAGAGALYYKKKRK